MAHLATETSPDTPRRILERALKNPSSTIWLGHVCVTTARFEEALGFYSGLLGLSLRTVERHPLHFDRLRAVLIDAEGQDVIELVEHPPTSGIVPQPGLNQLGFRLPRRSWLALRSRLDAHDVPYDLTADALSLDDPDGIRLRVEPLGAC